jgi:hypothetical protein
LERGLFFKRVQRLLWWWRLRAVLSVVWRLLLAILILSPVIIVVFIGLSALVLALPLLVGWVLLVAALAASLAALLHYGSSARPVRMRKQQILKIRKEVQTTADVAPPKDWEIPALFLDEKHRSGEGLEGLLRFAVAGCAEGFVRMAALFSLGARAAASVLYALAQSPGPVPLCDIAALLDEEADIERAILGVAHINGIILILDNEPARLAMTSALRRRLQQTR